MLKHGFRQMFLGMEQVSSLSRLLNLHRLLQQKESNQLKKENKTLDLHPRITDKIERINL